MPDKITSEQRSKNMAAVHDKNTKPEVYLRKLLHARGYRYSLFSKTVPGHPDLFLRKYNTAVFVNGCFWHRHEGCKYATVPKTREDFWNEKFEKNIRRDEYVRKQLSEEGIKVLTVWECTIKRMKRDSLFELQILKQIDNFFISDNTMLEL